MRLDFIIFAPELLISIWLIILIIQFTISTKKKYVFIEHSTPKFFIKNPIPGITSLLLILAFYYLFLQATIGHKNFYTLAGLYSNSTIYYIKLILALLFVLYLIYLRTNMNTLIFYSYEFYIIIFFAFLALNFILVSANFLNLFIFIEIYSMCVYYLVSSKKNSVKGIEASIKYFIVGSFSSAFLLFGIFLLYYSTGCIDLIDINHLTYQNVYFQNSLIYLIGAYIICFSILIKMGASIFFFWIVEVYDGVSFNMLIFLNIFPKLVYLITLLNIVNSLNLWHLVLVIKFFLLSSLFIGLLGAINETKIKKFLTFTSLYNLTFFSLPFWNLSNESVKILILFLSVYLINFFIFMTLFSNLKDMRTGIISKNLIDLYELRAQNPKLAFLFVFFAFFASGLPMTAVFLVKFSFFFELSRLNFMFLLIYFLILSTFSFFYYIRIIKMSIQSVTLPNILVQPISQTNSLLYSFVLFFNFLVVFFFDEITLLLNCLGQNV